MKLLEDFKAFKVSRSDLTTVYGENLICAKITTPVTVTTDDVVNAICKFRNGEITQETLLDWVNTLWFTELFDYAEKQDDTIASVMDKLEELDEDGVSYSDADYEKMIDALKNNKAYKQ